MLSFRQATINDIDSIITIEEQSFAAGIKEAREVFLERIRVFPAGFLLLETKESDSPIGYICSELWPGEHELQLNNLTLGHSIQKVHHPQGQKLYISSMGVLPEFRGRGYGELLLNQLIAVITRDYPQVKSVVLIVSENWLAARKTYQKLGFQEIGLIPAFFQPVDTPSEQGIIMRKKIS
ncbi:GNAT family N-acetyltransferase [Desulforamulus ferrireducens]|uniref:N-acetyltransferase domain-containing protein n=1 Tax=Desulforamulus ferrireducens TaxID=1833852 RepID=A0A1S6IWP0_9FIRM|nr:N-acetyltransferase [Desulforamulus ferrireducens]AQS59191.1 hypothetical protein B0537_08940 [Desulforamulus ferrireducens]